MGILASSAIGGPGSVDRIPLASRAHAGDYLAIVTLGFGEIINRLSKSDVFTPPVAHAA
jgi:hypothetical protein